VTQNGFKIVTHRRSAQTLELTLPKRGPAPSEECTVSPLAPISAPRTRAVGGPGRFLTPFNSHWVPASALPRPRQIGVAGYVDGVPVRVFEPRPAADLDESVLSNRLRVTWGRRRHVPEE